MPIYSIPNETTYVTVPGRYEPIVLRSTTVAQAYSSMSISERRVFLSFIIRHADCENITGKEAAARGLVPDNEHFSCDLQIWDDSVRLEVTCWCGCEICMDEYREENRFESFEATEHGSDGKYAEFNFVSGQIAEKAKAAGDAVMAFDGPQEMRASRLAMKAHEGAVDKAGAPYIEHPKAVAARVEGDAAKAVAWLHDVLEDTDATVEDLRGEGISEEVIEGVIAMTRREGEDYLDFVRRAKENPLARQVKLADVIHNMNLSRLKTVDAAAIKRLEEKYLPALKILTEG